MILLQLIAIFAFIIVLAGLAFASVNPKELGYIYSSIGGGIFTLLIMGVLWYVNEDDRRNYG